MLLRHREVWGGWATFRVLVSSRSRFTVKPILMDSCTIPPKAVVTSGLVHPILLFYPFKNFKNKSSLIANKMKINSS